MKRLAWLIVFGAGLTGCVAVPVAGPAYGPYGPPAVVVKPYVGFGYYGGYYGSYGYWRHWR